MEEVKKEVAVVEEKQVSVSPAQMVQVLIEKGMKPEDLEKMLVLQERYEANQARKAYHMAMANFKANAPEIKKDKKVRFKTSQGETAYNHASLYNVTNTINEALSKHGLSASWKTAQNGTISVTCKITHSMGHSEETTLTANSDTSGSKNSIQAMCSTITYLERYSLLALTGLATSDQDDDGQSSEIEYIDEKQLSQLRDFIDNDNVNLPKFLEYMGLEELEKMPKGSFQKALSALQQKRKEKK